MAAFRQAAKALFTTLDRLQEPPPGPRILIYHQVGAGLGRQMEVTRADFEWQVDWLTRNREVVHLQEALLRWTEPGADLLVVLTFDDGYRDTYEVAFPALLSRSLPFTLYLATESIEKQEGDPKAAPLTWDQIAEMIGTGLVTVGSHTHTHRDLRDGSPDKIESELSESDAIIEERIGLVPNHFAYPWGYWSQAADDLVRERYQSASLGSYRGPPYEFDPHLLHRFPVQLSDGRRWFRARLDGGLLMEERIRRLLRGYQGK